MKPELPTPDLKSVVLKRIEHENLCPHSKWYFSGFEGMIWFLWLITVVSGAVAVAVTLSVVVYRRYAFFEATHETFFKFMVEVLPAIWFGVFGLMVVLAVYNLRNTKYGYRYPLWQIFGSSILLSVTMGSLLHFIGIGFMLDEQLGKKVAMYNSQIKMEEKMWQMPEQGRLIGMTHMTESEFASGQIKFVDVSGVEWILNVTELDNEDVEFLNLGKRVRVIGQKDIEGNYTFHACAIFPWVYEKQYSSRELVEFRHSMQRRVKRFSESVRTNDQDLAIADSVCASLNLVYPK